MYIMDRKYRLALFMASITLGKTFFIHDIVILYNLSHVRTVFYSWLLHNRAFVTYFLLTERIINKHLQQAVNGRVGKLGVTAPLHVGMVPIQGDACVIV